MNTTSTLAAPQKTLSCIEILMNIYWSPKHNLIVTHERDLAWAIHNDLVMLADDGWMVTPRGKAYVESIRDIPLPVWKGDRWVTHARE